MYLIEKIDIMEKLLRKIGSNHDPEALDAARRLKALSTRWGIGLEALHSTSSQSTGMLREKARQFWKREDTKRQTTPNISQESMGEDR